MSPSYSIHDQLDPARVEALHHTLSLSGDAPVAGDPVPPFWHHIYFWQPRPPRDLGPDSHIKTGTGLIPDMGLPQRMWAGGRLIFHTPLIIGTPARKTSNVEETTRKTGRSGPLAFVTVRHEYRQNDQICVTEHQSLVFKNFPKKGQLSETQFARTDELTCQPATFPPTLLFRYSALTFNGHRIHYDVDYCRDVEGYSGLVVHGPLLAQSLMQIAQTHLGSLNTFTFRAFSPLMHFETAELCRNGADLWVRGPDGRLCMAATAT